MKRTAVSLTVVALLVLAGNALAMRSDNYWLDWFTPLTGGGGGPADSDNYAANFTIGQSAIGAADSTNYEAGLGYWYGAAGGYEIYLPLILKNYSPSYVSDRNIKENLSPVSGKEVLDRLDSIPISTWNYKTQDAAVRHMGPMAQDFYAAFGLGDDEHSISVVDANGVSLAAIQGLYRLLQEKDAQIVSQQRQIAELETRITALEATTSSKTTSSQPWQSALLLGAVLPIGLGLAWVARRRHG